MAERVIALDPGGTTGWATWTKSGEEESFFCGQIGPHDHHEELFDFLELQHVQKTVIVCESFEFRQNKQRDNINLMSKEYIGVTKLFGKQRRTPVVFQTAGAAKGFVTDDKLKVMGLYVPGFKHSMDAYRHLVHYMVLRMGRKDMIESWRKLV